MKAKQKWSLIWTMMSLSSIGMILHERTVIAQLTRHHTNEYVEMCLRLYERSVRKPVASG